MNHGIFAHLSLLALQPCGELRLPALRPDQQRYYQGDRRTRHPQRNRDSGRRCCRDAVVRTKSAIGNRLLDQLLGLDGAEHVRTLAATRPVPAGKIHGRQRQKGEGEQVPRQRQRTQHSGIAQLSGLQPGVAESRGRQYRRQTESCQNQKPAGISR